MQSRRTLSKVSESPESKSLAIPRPIYHRKTQPSHGLIENQNHSSRMTLTLSSVAIFLLKCDILETLDPKSRLDFGEAYFGEAYTIEHNPRVSRFGKVHTPVSLFSSMPCTKRLTSLLVRPPRSTTTLGETMIDHDCNAMLPPSKKEYT